jgi:uncharacterized sulfatase
MHRVPLFLLAYTLISSAAIGAVAKTARAADRPNVVIIVSDDQAYTDFGFMGHPLVRTPNIDRLASMSARYPNAYVPSSVCRPSLATLLTGLYPHQHGIHFNHPPPGNGLLTQSSEMTAEKFNGLRRRAEYLIRSVPSLPRILAENGYRTFQAGKYWEGHYQTAGFTHGMTLGRASAEPAYGNKKLPDGSIVAHGNGDAGLNIGRTTMQPIDDFLDRHGDEPFLIFYAPFLPHAPHDAPQEFLDPYADNPQVPRHFVGYYASCTWFDDTVGRLIRSLEERGLARETLFLFVVDNGWEPSTTPSPAGNEHEFAVDIRSKRSPFDLGLRTPILIRWDGHVKPATHEALLSTVDVVPSILSAVGLSEHARGMPGVDLMPSALGQRSLESRAVFGEIYPGDATSLGHPSRDVAYRWVRQGDWKLVVPHRQKGQVWRDYVAGPSLFSVVDDPREEHDLSGLPEQAARTTELTALLDAWWTPGDDSAVAKPPEYDEP